jgi:hypothetical protein
MEKYLHFQVSMKQYLQYVKGRNHWQMNRPREYGIYIHISGYYLASKRKEILSRYNVNEPWVHKDQWNKPVTEGQTLHSST